MIITGIELNQFRNYERLSLSPHEGINILFGANGSGKTNLLESIHYCSLGRSHRMNQDLSAVQSGRSSASCRLSIQGRWSRNDLEIQLHPREDAVKSVWIDGKKIARLSEMMGVLRCVIFSPEDLSLIREGPSLRRRFLDMMISQMNRRYFVALQQYRIAMNQRNAILRQARTENRRVDPMIADFEASMSDQARIICGERMRYGEMLSDFCGEIYGSISGNREEVFAVGYQPSVKFGEDGGFPMAEMLSASREEDLRQGITSLGPHRDELAITLNRRSMKTFASQGQTRTGALSLKLAQMKIIGQMTEDQPVLLLDDVMSELDLRRRMNLLELIQGVQTFITCSDEGDLSPTHAHRTYHVFSREGMAALELRQQGPLSEPVRMREPTFD